MLTPLPELDLEVASPEKTFLITLTRSLPVRPRLLRLQRGPLQ
jgi:hypothetical protein